MSESRQQRRARKRKGLKLIDARGDDVTPFWENRKFIVPVPAYGADWESKIGGDVFSAVNMHGAETESVNTAADTPTPEPIPYTPPAEPTEPSDGIHIVPLGFYSVR